MSHSPDLALLLEKSQAGDREAWKNLLEIVYPSMKKIIANRIKPYRDQITIDTTDLAHDVYLEFDKQRSFSWHNREHFFSVLARVSRRVVIDYLRSRSCEKRGAGVNLVPVDEDSLPFNNSDKELWLTINRLLESLGNVDPEIVELTELRYFAGFSLEEIAGIKKLSVSTIKRQWRFARAWLNQQLDEEIKYA
ncbi:ECF-type sigma factor [Alteromonas ponticola]|uniref:ECF-type sigma factor n=1 Tax=Alteromonas aquimaris TaxID=2998417 RepID=A0ABT3P580_9ALTE|nr:ECF-type sigma factor [Alteromonas aquimaris]MCW8107931.1 ECF-type sigma factor [Alteromonas aquimaris]